MNSKCYKEPNAYYVRVVNWDDQADEDPKPTEVLGPMKSRWKAEKVQRGISINMNHEQYYCEYVWIGPDKEPEE